MKRIYIQLITISVAILFLWFLPDVVGDTINRIIIGWIAGWQIGAWAFEIGNWLGDKYDNK